VSSIFVRIAILLKQLFYSQTGPASREMTFFLSFTLCEEPKNCPKNCHPKNCPKNCLLTSTKQPSRMGLNSESRREAGRKEVRRNQVQKGRRRKAISRMSHSADCRQATRLRTRTPAWAAGTAAPPKELVPGPHRRAARVMSY
jgi:hypothetical protein